MDSDIKKEDGYTVVYSSGEVSGYPSQQCPSEIHGYYSEVDWQNGGLDPSRSMYTLAPRQDIQQLQFYHGYSSVAHSDLYPGANIWHPPEGGIQLTGDPPISHGLVPRRDNTRHGSSAPQRPKRRRTQSLVQRRAANVRERRRMFQLNEAFDALRKKLPAFNYEKRLSRIETLRLAMTYISFMQDVTSGTDPSRVKLLSYHNEDSNPAHDLTVQVNGYHSPMSNGFSSEMQEEESVENLEMANQPPTLLEMPVPAVQVEIVPCVPAQISLPVTNQEVLTDQRDETQSENTGTTETTENTCRET